MGSYELEASLGSGPGSTTWRAISTAGGSYGQQVVLTTVPASTSSGEIASLDNLLGISELWHFNLAKTFNVGRSGGQVFVAAEYVEGISLNALVRTMREQGRNAPRRQVLRALGIACKALAHLHERGLYHGGVDSRRVMLTESGWVKLRGAGLIKLGESYRIADGLTDRCQGKDRWAVVKMIDELALTDDPWAACALRELRRQSRPEMNEVSEALLSAAELDGPSAPPPGRWWQAPAGSRNAA